jgi:hypothetical protein
VIYAIVACEAGFWLVLLAGLALRYLGGRHWAGGVVLACVPLVDLALLVFTVLHLRSGAEIEPLDGLAAVYLGVSVGFGKPMLTWADARFGHRFAGGPAPVQPPKAGPAHARRERRLWYRHLLAFAVGSVLLLAGARLVGGQPGPLLTWFTGGQTAQLLSWIPRWGVVLVIDFLWSFSYTFWPRRPRTS